MRRAPALPLVLPLALGAAVALGLPAATASAADETGRDVECSAVQNDGTVAGPLQTAQHSKPAGAMDVTAAWTFLAQHGHEKVPGRGVTVAVLDSGVATAGTAIPVAHRVTEGTGELRSYHGTDVAGLIAGPPAADGTPIGIAPGAQIFDVQVYDDPDAEPGSDQGTPILVDNVVKGLHDVLANVATYHIKVLTIALALPPSHEVASLIGQLWDAGVVTVAASGNRPDGTETQGAVPSTYATFHPGEDASGDIHPADDPAALTVSTTLTGLPSGETPQSYLLQSSAIDVAAPTAGGVSYSVLGGTCLNTRPATSWAAAEVSGVLALTQSYFHESPARAVSRLLHTASGMPGLPNDLVGAGEVQPYEALTRPLQMDADGTVLNQPVAQSEPQVLRPPATPPDVLASTRRNAIWWGLLGGGALVLALVLRPVLARRRPGSRR